MKDCSINWPHICKTTGFLQTVSGLKCSKKPYTWDTIQNKYMVHRKSLQSIEYNSHETQHNSLQLIITNMISNLWILMLKYRHGYLSLTPKKPQRTLKTKWLSICKQIFIQNIILKGIYFSLKLKVQFW